MRQLLHLLIVDRLRHLVLGSRHGTRWLLPVLICGERVRSGPLITNWLAAQGIVGDVVGHWLGRLTREADGIDWLVAVDALRGSCEAGRALQWMPIDEVHSCASLIDYQQWAVEKALQAGPLPSVRGPFGSFTWPGEVKNWICTIEGESRPCRFIPYRCTAQEVVLGAQTTHDIVYFKGLARDRWVEAQVTLWLSALAPESFARTIAIEPRPDGSMWWLTAACPGKPATHAAPVAHALARMQQLATRWAHNVPELPALKLERAAAWSAELLKDAGCALVIERACAALSRADLPQSWIPLDLDLSNVLVANEGQVRFIDLDDSFLGPAPLAIAVLARRCRDISLYRSYEQIWSPPLTGVDWRSVEIVAAMLEAWLGWLRVKRNTELEEVRGLLDLATERIRGRLTVAIEYAARADERTVRSQSAGF